jgi:predicted DNA-binding transcriptional regulator AlpA
MRQNSLSCGLTPGRLYCRAVEPPAIAARFFIEKGERRMSEMKTADYVLSRKETAERLGISLPTLGRIEATGELPRIKISTRRVGFRESDISKFLDTRIAVA